MKTTKNGTNGVAENHSASQIGNYRNEEADSRIATAERDRDAVVIELQSTTVELLELYHNTKQSHWNLRGPLYYPLHETLDEYAEQYQEFIDKIAERVLHMGSPVDGRSETVYRTCELPKFPGGFLSDRQVLDLMSNRINEVALRVGDRIDRLDEIDKTSSNVLQELKYAMDKQIWQLRVTQQ